MTDPMLPLAGLSPVDGKAVVAKFDGGLLSSDGGVLALREAEQRLGRWRTISPRISGSSVRRPFRPLSSQTCLTNCRPGPTSAG